MTQSALKTLAIALATGAALLAVTAAAQAGPIQGATWVFSTSTGTQPSNVGTITLSQYGNSTNSVEVKVDLINSAMPNSANGYGFVNTGGPHTPFAFQLNGDPNNLTISFVTPTSGFSLDTAGGQNTPYGTFNTALDYAGAQGSGSAYYGDLDFILTRTSGTLYTEDFVKNGPNGTTGYVFSADLTDGKNTGAQAWAEGIDPPSTSVPEPFTMSLFGAGLAGMAALRRRKSISGAAVA